MFYVKITLFVLDKKSNREEVSIKVNECKWHQSQQNVDTFMSNQTALHPVLGSH